MLLSRYQHLRDDGKCTSIFDSYKAIIELRKKFLEEFNVVILKLFRVDLLEQATQINIIMLDLNNSEAEFNERRDCVSKVLPNAHRSCSPYLRKIISKI